MPRLLKVYLLPALPLLAVALFVLWITRQSVPQGPNGAPAPPAAPSHTNSIGMELVLIPAGKFVMGSPRDEKYHQPDESPQHEVEISQVFYLGAYEVTQAQYRKVMGTNPSLYSATGDARHEVKGMATDDFPVEQVNWMDAQRFCARLSALPREKAAGLVYRLPTEAEWEYACRAGSKTPFHTGTALTTEQANFDGRTQYLHVTRGTWLGRTTKVGSYPPNAWGLYDMHGNVSEWCQDWFGREYYKSGITEDPPGPAIDAIPVRRRVARGGSWVDPIWNCRAAARLAGEPDYRNYRYGLRVACTIPSRARQ
jgi:formylglycine-generating enzyme required for sulfatase activity